MNHLLRNKYIILLLFFFSQQLLAIKHLHRTPKNINDVITFHFNDLDKITERYNVNMRDIALFNQEQKILINNEGLYELIDLLLLHDDIVLEEPKDLIEYARKIKASGYILTKLKKRIVRYQEKGMEVFPALDKAIEQEHLSEWYEHQKHTISHYDSFRVRINGLELKEADREKITNVYAMCVNPWRNEEYRLTKLAPKYCDAIAQKYTNPRHSSQNIDIRTKDGTRDTPRNHAYQILVEEARSMASELNMSAAERLVMSKCVAEKSLLFVEPRYNPMTSIKKIHAAHTKSPAHTFFSNHGVCTNFSALTFNFARKMGLENDIFLAERNMHTYIELKIDNKWYHSHPFNSSFTGCDLIPFEAFTPEEASEIFGVSTNAEMNISSEVEISEETI